MSIESAKNLPEIFKDVPIFEEGSFKKSDYRAELAAAGNKFSAESLGKSNSKSCNRYESEKLKQFTLRKLKQEAEVCRFEDFQNKILLGFFCSQGNASVFKVQQKILILKLLLMQEKEILCVNKAKKCREKEKVRKGFEIWNTIWVKTNWFRLLIIRIKRSCYAFSEFPRVIHQAIFSVMNADFSALSACMAPLSYSIYLLRIATLLAPFLIHACVFDGWTGLKAALWDKSKSLTNDLVWFSIGITTTIISALGFPMVSMLLVCVLYLFDVLNEVCHDVRNKMHHKNKQENLVRQINSDIAQEELINMQLLFPLLKRMLRNAPENYLLVSFTMDLYKAMARDSEAKSVRELKKIGPDFTEDQAKRLLMYTQDKIKEQAMLAGQCKILGHHFPFSVIDSCSLLTGVIGTTVGTGLVLAGMGAQFLTTSSIIPAILAAAAALTLTSMIGLSLIAAGVIIVLVICAVRLTKDIIESIKKPKNEKRRQRSVLRAAEYSNLSKEKTALSY